MHIPQKKLCQHLLDEMSMPAHIQAHSHLVCKVALLLTQGLLSAGVSVDIDLIQAAALLHDITKSRSFITGENHALTGGEYLSSLGYHEVGEIVRQHVVLDAYFSGDHPNEAEVVNYADKRVLHDRIVSLAERMDYIMYRYAKTHAHQQRFRQVRTLTETLEQRIFQYLVFPPDEVPLLLDSP
ncbi:MAG: HDIG domain-containing protein [Desulfobacteraceae bacterium]|nr:HDIG domain-containing protein [Desulfobacteraceae bacterium]